MTDDIRAFGTPGAAVLTALSRFPNRLAVRDERESLTYADLQARLELLIAALKQLGVRPGDGIAILAPNSSDVVLLFLAAMVMGLRNTPLHPLGSEDDQAFILDDAEIAYLFVDEERYAERGSALDRRVARLRAVAMRPTPGLADLQSLLSDAEAMPLRVERGSHDIVTIAYTGGTTGRPKGVVLPVRSIMTSIMTSLFAWEWPKEPVFLASTPISHAAGMMVLPTMMLGGTVVLAGAFSPVAFLAAVERFGVNCTFLVPTMIYALLDHLAEIKSEAPQIETIIYGASGIATDRLAQALRVFGRNLVQLYGQTEAPNCIAALGKRDHDPDKQDRLASCGTPLPLNQVAIIGDDGLPVGPGQTGEIAVRGPLVMDGYWKRSEETARALRDGWLRTGDVGRFDADGYLFIVDRIKDMIVTGGFNVYPREIEDVLATHPEVEAVAVYGVSDKQWGEAVWAAIVSKSLVDKLALAEVLKANVRERKGALYVPKRIVFVESLPMTALGKPDKKALRNTLNPY